MANSSRVDQEVRLAALLSDSPDQERCELILWIEADWRCEYWLLAESGVMRLYNGPDTILEVPVTDAITALRDAKMWHDVVLRAGCATATKRGSIRGCIHLIGDMSI